MKKLFCFLLISLLSVNVYFVWAENNENKTAVLHLLSIMEGDGNGNYMLDRDVTRAEMTKMVISASDYRSFVAPQLKISPFPDVSYQLWSAPYIHVALMNGLVSGYEDATFRPNRSVTFEEGVTMLLRVLGYTDNDFGDSWPYGQLGIAQNIGLTDQINCTVGATLTRRDCMNLFYNLLFTTPKNAQGDYIQKLGYTFYEDTVLLATVNEDTSLGATKISTSSGVFENKAEIQSSHLGLKGDVLCYGNDLMLFLPTRQSVCSFIVYQILSDQIVAVQNGEYVQLDASENPTIYNKNNRTTLESLLNSLELGDVLTYYYNEDNLLDYGIVTTGKLEGPFIIHSVPEMQSQYSTATVYRNSISAVLDNLCENDVYYYSEALDTIFAYAKKVTGIYEKATPHRDQPQSVTVSGTTYAIESLNAAHELSSRGSLVYGDTVTLLLGKNGDVAGVMNEEDTKKEEVFGYVTNAGKKQFTNADGVDTSSYFITLTQTDGQSIEYKTKGDADDFIGKVVSLTFSSGYASISTVKSTSINATIHADTYTIGSHTVSKNVQILEYIPQKIGGIAGNFHSVYFSRLDGVSLSGKTVYTKMNGNEITEMIIADITGDLYTYGIVTSVSGGISFDVGGTVYQANGFNLSKGQFVKITGTPSHPSALTVMNSLKNCREITRHYIINKSGTKYTLSDDVVIYDKNTDGEYFVISIEEALEKNTPFTAAYDRSDASGGRVRIVVFE